MTQLHKTLWCGVILNQSSRLLFKLLCRRLSVYGNILQANFGNLYPLKIFRKNISFRLLNLLIHMHYSFIIKNIFVSFTPNCWFCVPSFCLLIRTDKVYLIINFFSFSIQLNYWWLFFIYFMYCVCLLLFSSILFGLVSFHFSFW